jgi:hypothetical protein
VKRLLVAVLGLTGAAAAAWAAFVRWQGDGEIVYDSDHLSDVRADDHSVHGEIGLTNRGKQGAVLYRMEGRIVEGPEGRVFCTRKGSRPPERGWWVSNVMKPGDSCVAEVDVELNEAVGPVTGPLAIELDVSEIARRLIVHRRLRVTVPSPASNP